MDNIEETPQFDSNLDKDTLVALHEAGHALVCCWLAHENNEVSYPEVALEAQGSMFGYTKWSLYLKGLEGARAKVKLAYGGFVAVSKIYGNDIAYLYGSEEDFDRIENLGFTLQENLEMKAEVKAVLNVFYAEYWELYDELLRKRHLSKQETRRIWLKRFA